MQQGVAALQGHRQGVEKEVPRVWGKDAEGLGGAPQVTEKERTMDKVSLVYYTDLESFGRELLPEIITWIRDNLKPDQVFFDWQLEEWADENGYVPEEE